MGVHKCVYCNLWNFTSICFLSKSIVQAVWTRGCSDCFDGSLLANLRRDGFDCFFAIHQENSKLQTMHSFDSFSRSGVYEPDLHTPEYYNISSCDVRDDGLDRS